MSMFFKSLVLISHLVVWLIIPKQISAQNTDVNLKGYVKELGGINFSNDLKTIRYNNILHHRLESRFKFEEHFEIRADIRNRLLNGYTVRSNPAFSSFLDQDMGYFDLSWILIDSKNTILHSQIDRLHFSYLNGPLEIHIGRQRINWGKSMVWNPNDVFNAYAYLDFDYEERPGTDAVYGSYSWSYASSIEAGLKFGNSFDESVLAMMYRGNIGEYDIQLIAGSYYEDLAIGAGWSGYLNNAGFKGEITYFTPRENFAQSGVVTSSVGMDYMFSNSIYLTTELLYNGGWNKSANPVAQLAQPPSADDLFIAKTGYFANASYPLNPLTNLSLGVMGSFDRKLVIFMPRVLHSLSENLDLLIIAQIMQGKVITDITETPNVLFFRLKWSY